MADDDLDCLVTVFRTTDQFTASMIQGALQQEGIECRLGGTTQAILPCVGTIEVLVRRRDLEEAVAVANDSKYGLGGGVWSRDISKAMTIALRVRTGMMWINTYGAIRGDVPFGGYGQSGLGREGGVQGYEAYTEPKSIMIETNPGASAPLFRDRKS